MSRHGRHVPTSFYYKFAQDARKLADRFAQGRLISVLEGGYSDRALTSGSMAHISGLAETTQSKVDENWWSLENLIMVNRYLPLTHRTLTNNPLHSWRKQPRNVAEAELRMSLHRMPLSTGRLRYLRR